jgi:DtxR family transcriptional regulator, Mn-dependent transcriptional regulator
MPTNSKEDYLKAILMLEAESDDAVSTTAIAQRLNMRPASVTGMIRVLHEAGWVNYEAYRGVTLTDRGRTIATDIIRKHRLWEVFLVDKLGFGWEEVHDLAEQLEHIDDPELVRRLALFLGNPKFDPHGDPIPTASGTMEDDRQLVRLSALAEGESGVVKGVVDSGDAFLAHLNTLGIEIGTKLLVKSRFAYDGSMEIQQSSGDIQRVCTRQVVDNLWIELA